ncbi:glyoxalase/bleomycin resistance protein/dioxygenase [Salinisphaera sp. C84B14]|uniref:VOC family protein n=1 Tax=Salinisphaera sp. C84B14 TaxID=1304155 RepID=UPI0032B293B8|tara:strand:- start:899 stop:1324 length:426 start_codon:yes stop_codon:yes gene_type:complete
MALSPFHLAIPVHDLPAARRFYGETFGLSEGRSSDQWVDFDFYGHQLVIHEHPKTPSQQNAHTNPVDGHDVPIPHFGIVLEWAEWETLAERLRERGTEFVIEPHIRFQGQPGEQATMFLLDPCGNALEFKAFADRSQLFAK